jgi:hypothetical protein
MSIQPSSTNKSFLGIAFFTEYFFNSNKYSCTTSSSICSIGIVRVLLYPANPDNT